MHVTNLDPGAKDKVGCTISCRREARSMVVSSSWSSPPHGRLPTDRPNVRMCRMYECTSSALQVSNVASAVAACSACLQRFINGAMLAGGEVVELRMLHASGGSNHCFLEFAQEGAARRALDCSGALLGIPHPFSMGNPHLVHVYVGHCCDILKLTIHNIWSPRNMHAHASASPSAQLCCGSFPFH